MVLFFMAFLNLFFCFENESNFKVNDCTKEIKENKIKNSNRNLLSEFQIHHHYHVNNIESTPNGQCTTYNDCPGCGFYQRCCFRQSGCSNGIIGFCVCGVDDWSIYGTCN